jgi:hypothetical protein
MTSLVFWNLNQCRKASLIAELTDHYNVDILILAECVITPSVLLTELNKKTQQFYDYSPLSICDKITIFTRFPHQLIQPRLETDRLTIRHLTLPGLSDILIAAVHFPSKLHWNDASQFAESVNLSNIIRIAEKEVKHSRTIIVGDFNMNPFEAGMVSANGLHGVMTKQIAQQRSRIVQKTEYPYFYNPMWSLMGDASPGQPGTFFYTKAEHACYFWNMFDQILLRPDLLECFDNRNLKIIDTINGLSLLSMNGRPSRAIASDHLPIYFELYL